MPRSDRTLNAMKYPHQPVQYAANAPQQAVDVGIGRSIHIPKLALLFAIFCIRIHMGIRIVRNSA